MKVTHPKNRGLIKQFPALQKVLELSLEPWSTHVEHADVTIRVEVADGNLMFRSSQNVGLADNENLLTHTDKKGLRWKGRQEERFFLLSKSHEILKCFFWPDAPALMFLKDMLLKDSRAGGGVYRPAHALSLAEYMVGVAVRSWTSYKPEIHAHSRTEVEIVVYRAPEGGIENLQRTAHLEDHLVLNIPMFQGGLEKRNEHFLRLEGRLFELASIFREEIGKAVVDGFVCAIRTREFVGASAFFGDILLSCSRFDHEYVITLKRGNSLIAFDIPVVPDQPVVVRDAQGGTFKDFRNMVWTVVCLWNDSGYRNQLRISASF